MKFRNILSYLNRRDNHLLLHINPLVKLILILIIAISSVFLTKEILAQNNNQGYGPLDIKTDTTGLMEEITNIQAATTTGFNLESWGNQSIIITGVSLNTAMVGNMSKKSASGNWVPGGLIGFTNNSIATLYKPPISGVQYIASTINNFMGKPTYAANGFGFDKLGGTNGIMSLWKTVRNAVYSLVSLFFIILGIMIMLRIKISPQATISIQVIIPKIIMTLILVTFSYAIVGLLIDFSYVFEGVILSLIIKSEGISNIFSTYDLPKLMNLNFYGIQDITSKYFASTENIALGGIGTIVGFILGILSGGWAMLYMPLIGGVIGLLLINVFIWIQLIKLFFGLAKCYINILLKIIIAPLEIGLGVFPGSKVNFSSWIVQLIANLTVFPATIIFLVIVTIFIKAVGGGGSNYFWAPNILANGEIVGFIIGLTGIMLLAKIPQIVPEFLFNIKPSGFDKVIGDSYKDWGGIKTLAHTGPGTFVRAKGLQYGGDALNKIGKNIETRHPGNKFAAKLKDRGEIYKQIGEEATGAKDYTGAYHESKTRKYIK